MILETQFHKAELDKVGDKVLFTVTEVLEEKTASIVLSKENIGKIINYLNENSKELGAD